ncbi:DegT/DnrJ/EryC1/StrS family aminotransferase [Metabacillus litoralis]|uniref:DegT/DnrJ/EryC1/StrS family aminotransferase n=1 Tax=Metabacillus litoralis TaxID=152268 RepID=UPI00203AEEDA|nr:DegT/DnrJ/EryC1/StrS family aminotransferase [Metabacillus litoralis]MCM3411851.1 DegT/DnrJ/EryC1/StrS family aminotransferase [Metabacillus litoralis]
MNIPMLDLKKQYQDLRIDILEELDKVMCSSQFILGSNLKKLEQDIANFSNVSHGIGCGSGSDAIHIALQALGISDGDEVITTPFTFFATGGSIVRTGAKPVFIDIDPVTFNIDPMRVEEAINEKTKAILPVHLYGQLSDMEQLSIIANKHNIKIVEDAAQAIGSKQNGKTVGQLSDAAAYSFFPTKNLGAYGDAGMIVTNDDNIAEKSRVIRVHGSKPKYFHHVLGYNSRLDELQAAILNIKFRYLEKWNDLRRQKAITYTNLLRDRLGTTVITPFEEQGNYHVFHQYTIRVNQRDKLQQFLKDQGISTMVYYPLPLHLQPVFEGLGYKEGDLPQAEKAAKEALSLPIFPELNMEQQEYVVMKIADFYGK